MTFFGREQVSGQLLLADHCIEIGIYSLITFIAHYITVKSCLGPSGRNNPVVKMLLANKVLHWNVTQTPIVSGRTVEYECSYGVLETRRVAIRQRMATALIAATLCSTVASNEKWESLYEYGCWPRFHQSSVFDNILCNFIR
jgi:hypothetical protein